MKTYVLTVSRVFPCTHKRKGEETQFAERISNIFCLTYSDCSHHDCGHCELALFPKIHTIRSNYELWAKRIEQIQKGEAILSIRYWSGKPYNSKQVEICQLDKDSGIGVQKLKFQEFIDFPYVISGGIRHENFWSVSDMAKNDGLSLEDFKEWFKGYDFSKPMAIIHFTKFRY